MRAWLRRLMTAGFVILATAAPAVAAEPAALTPAQALARLKQGNDRFVADRSAAEPIGGPRRTELVAGQHPFATVLSCADSRVPPELVFNVGLGDLFVVRTAGEVTDHAVLASIEYAIEHLHTPLLVVMGHTACGAVQAASEPHNGSLGPNLDYLVNAIHPAVEHTAGAPASGRMKAAILANVDEVIHGALAKSAIIKHAVVEGHLQMVGGFYELSNGAVTFMKPVTAESVGAQHTSR